MVLVVGGGGGIGRATAELAGQRGASVVVADIDGVAAETVAQRIKTNGGVARAVRADATRIEDIERCRTVCLREFGGLTAGVLSVFADAPAPITELSETAWDHTISVGLRSAYVLAHVILRDLRAVPNASLTFVSSIQARFGYRGMAAYSAAKAGVLGLVRQLAVDYGPDGVRVNAVLPALVLTDRNRDLWEGDPELLDRQARLFPLRRVGAPGDVASVIAFLMSEDAAFVTGAAIPVDGGMAAQPAAAAQWSDYADRRSAALARGAEHEGDGAIQGCAGSE